MCIECAQTYSQYNRKFIIAKQMVRKLHPGSYYSSLLIIYLSCFLKRNAPYKFLTVLLWSVDIGTHQIDEGTHQLDEGTHQTNAPTY